MKMNILYINLVIMSQLHADSIQKHFLYNFTLPYDIFVTQASERW